MAGKRLRRPHIERLHQCYSYKRDAETQKALNDDGMIGIISIGSICVCVCVCMFVSIYVVYYHGLAKDLDDPDIFGFSMK